MMSIRRARKTDSGAINRIYNAAVRDSTATLDTEARSLKDCVRWLREHGRKYPVLVAVGGKVVLGYAALSRWSPKSGYAATVELSVYVDENFRRRGLGRKLMWTILKLGRTFGFHAIVSRIVEGGQASIRLHRRMGFSRVGRMKEAGRKFGRNLDVLIYQKLV